MTIKGAYPKVSWLKKALSYLYDIKVESTSSPYNECLDVFLSKGRYSLATKNAVYSYEDLYWNFRIAFEKLPLDQLNIQKVLILGLGLGSIPLLLEQKFEQNYTYTVVEIDAKVIELAQKYGFASRGLSSPIELVCADAFSYLENCTASYDLIAIDLFIDNEVPEQFERIDFLQNTKRCLSPKGILMYNRLAYKKNLAKKTQSFFQDTFKKIYPMAIELEIKGNKMLVNREVTK
ncbi:MAG: methyltransferase domain-containing protein [Saprospiraceae bacterium]|nr:methyltransferase domain-containing protein [Saprospiraceae bacterium]